MSDNVLPKATVPVVLSGAFQGTALSELPHDFLIDGIPFLLKPTAEQPYMRDIPEDRAQQFDNSAEAGEQSFGQWWLRSQSSFHGGEGQVFLDATNLPPEVSRTRFDESSYLYPFEPGQLTPAAEFDQTVVNFKALQVVIWSAQRRLAQMSGADNTITVSDLPNLSNPDVITLGSSGVCQDMTTDGENLYVAVNDSVYRVDDTGTAVEIATITFTGATILGWAKQRLVLCTGREIYIVDPDPPTPPAAPPVHYTNPSPGWRYTSVADGPNGIYVTGYTGLGSDVSLMTITESAGTIELGAPVPQLAVPPGEQINDLLFFANSIFCVATSEGTRVGEFTPYGQPQAGALMMEGTACYSIAASSDLFFIGAADSIWWVDPGTQVDVGPRYAAAQAAGPLTGAAGEFITDIAVSPHLGRDLVYAVAGDANILFTQDSTTFVPADGYLVTSWVRFDTVEPKRLHHLRVQGNFPDTCELTVTVETVDGASQSFTLPGGQDTYELRVTLPASEAFRLRFDLCEDSVLRSYQMKALPEQRRQPELVLPLMCFDREQGALGQIVDRHEYAKSRLFALEEAARLSRAVTVVDRISNVSYLAVIKQMRYAQEQPPARLDRMGGYVTLILKVV